MPRLAAYILSPLVLVLALLAPPPGHAADAAQIDRLWTLMRMPEVIEVMRAEGLDYGASLDEDMLGGQGGAGWAAEVDAIYDAARMGRESRADFALALERSDLTETLAFFESPLGRRALDLELTARQTLLDPDLDAAARLHAQEMREAGDPRMDLIDRFVQVNDMIESNVAGALNANYAFYQGLAEGGAFEEDFDEAAILEEVWGQEPEVRDDTAAWVESFLALAYQPLSDDELEAYTAYSATASGQELNRAIFRGFDRMFNDISKRLGLGVAKRLVGEEL
jgi:hypothetical protein